jgi:hypothetical protein
MCNTCVQAVQSVSKSRGREYNLCAASQPNTVASGISGYLSTNSTHFLTHHFSTQNPVHTNLLNRMLSTLYTWPITNYNYI